VTSRLKDGLYRVELEYITNYPGWTNHWVETAQVRRAQGLRIPTRVWGPSRPGIGNIVSTPSTFSPDGDGRFDTMWLDFTVDKPAMVTVNVFDSRGNFVAQPLTNAPRAASRQSARWNGKRGNGTWLPAGKYYLTVYAGNAAGQRVLTGSVDLSYAR